MPELAAALSHELSGLSRRQMIAAVASGSLLGSAWAAAFRGAVLADEEPNVTVARTGTALGVLVDHRGHRILLIDAADGPGADTVTELATGFLRRRIDAVLLPAAAASVLPRDYRARWRVREVWTLPDGSTSSPSNLAGRSLHIERLQVDADALPRGAWRAGAPGESRWYVAASYGQARLTVASDAETIRLLPLDTSLVNAIVCADATLELPAVSPEIDTLAVPVETLDKLPEDPRIVPLLVGAAVTFRLRENAIDVTEAS
jgi:hypothetical protein